jgi:hypothetical protein
LLSAPGNAILQYALITGVAVAGVLEGGEPEVVEDLGDGGGDAAPAPEPIRDRGGLVGEEKLTSS